MSALFASSPALPLHTAGPYVAAAYVFFLAILIVYVAIMATKLQRMKRDLGELTTQIDERDRRDATRAGESVNGDAAHAPVEDADAVAARTVVKGPSA